MLRERLSCLQLHPEQMQQMLQLWQGLLGFLRRDVLMDLQQVLKGLLASKPCMRQPAGASICTQALLVQRPMAVMDLISDLGWQARSRWTGWKTATQMPNPLTVHI